jgi:hypothetical protein
MVTQLASIAWIGALIWLYTKAAERVRKHHVQTWLSLGSPDEFAGDPPPTFHDYVAIQAFLGFLWKGNVAVLGDKTLMATVYCWRVMASIALTASIVLIIHGA